MKMNFLIIILSITMLDVYSQTYIKKVSNFQELIDLFPEQKLPSKYKAGEIDDSINSINKKDAINYLHLTEDELKMNDYDYNHDEEIQYDNWVDVLPGALGKISNKKYVALIFALLKNPAYGLETYKTLLTTFTYDGEVIDSIVVRSQYTREEDWRDVVFLENDVLRIFDYAPNFENYNVESGIYYIIDKEQPQTVVEIRDYQIDEDGQINMIKEHPKRYLKEFVSFYRSYQPNSDDPMNEYDW